MTACFRPSNVCSMSEEKNDPELDTEEEETPEFSDQELSEAIHQVETSSLPAKNLIIKCLQCVSHCFYKIGHPQGIWNGLEGQAD